VKLLSAVCFQWFCNRKAIRPVKTLALKRIVRWLMYREVREQPKNPANYPMCIYQTSSGHSCEYAQDTNGHCLGCPLITNPKKLKPNMEWIG